MVDELRSLVSSHPNLASLVEEFGTSYEKRTIYAVKVSFSKVIWGNFILFQLPGSFNCVFLCMPRPFCRRRRSLSKFSIMSLICIFLMFFCLDIIQS